MSEKPFIINATTPISLLVVRDELDDSNFNKMMLRGLDEAKAEFAPCR